MKHKKIALIICFIFVSVTAMTLFASTAQAQQKACVFIKVGAGFSGKMRVISGSWKSEWSSDMAIGGQRCQSLENLSPGAPFSVQFKADLGKTVTCTPSDIPYNPKDPGNANYFAWGTTLKVKCSQDANAAEKKPGKK